MWYAPPVEDKELEKSSIWQTVYQPRRISEDDWGLYCLLQYRTATAWPGCPHALWKTWAAFSNINKTADSGWQLLLLTRIRGCHSAAALCFHYFFLCLLDGVRFKVIERFARKLNDIVLTGCGSFLGGSFHFVVIQGIKRFTTPLRAKSAIGKQLPFFFPTDSQRGWPNSFA